MSGPRSVLITGSNRGIGLELVRQFLQQGATGDLFKHPHIVFTPIRPHSL